ncbi:unnamed protein product [Paramecium octaurelia]|uniref:Uncharacterized protein n=1 Tax=Paramecium octaurelia TaxID=43137 RepID=A0A8S1S5X7_PAROT|nr:unnamed protein product [Paramecium octaurelia]
MLVIYIFKQRTHSYFFQQILSDRQFNQFTFIIQLFNKVPEQISAILSMFFFSQGLLKNNESQRGNCNQGFWIIYHCLSINTAYFNLRNMPAIYR